MPVCVLQNLENTEFYGPIFSFLSRNKSVIKFKIQSKTGKTDAFSSPEVQIKSSCLSAKLKCRIKPYDRHTAGAAEGQNM